MSSSHKPSHVEDFSKSELFHKIGEICSLVNEVTTTDELLSNSLHSLMSLFSARRGSIFIYHEENNELFLRVSAGMEISDRENFVKSIGKGIVGKVAELRSPVVVDDIREDKRFENYQARASYSTPSFICAPMLIKDQLVGIVNLSDKENKKSFNENDLKVLDFLISQVALNYSRVELYEQLKFNTQKVESLKDKLGKTQERAKTLKKKIDIQEKFASIGKLAGGIAHEFNNPLDGVMRYTNLCLNHIKDEDEIVRNYLIEIQNGLQRMANIVRNLLACSRSDENLNHKKVSLQYILDHSIQSVQSFLALKNINFHAKIPENLPLVIDLGLERVVVNLIRNAVDSMKENGTIVLEVVIMPEEGIFEIQVSDTGHGIEEETIEKIFEPFYTTKDIDKGCGLGLTIVSEIIKAYQGKLSVQSEIGTGTTFFVSIPFDSNI